MIGLTNGCWVENESHKETLVDFDIYVIGISQIFSDLSIPGWVENESHKETLVISTVCDWDLSDLDSDLSIPGRPFFWVESHTHRENTGKPENSPCVCD